jgi:hypothetical protein
MGIIEVFKRFWYSGDDFLDRKTLPSGDLQRCLTEEELELLDSS